MTVPALAPSTIPTVIAELLRIGAASSSLQSSGGIVLDGPPSGNEPNDIFSVGGASSPTSQDTNAYATLGSQRVEEDYEVECIISCFRGGGADQQPVVRTAAFAIFDDIFAGLRTSFTQGGVLGQTVYYAGIDSLELQQTTTETAADGRHADITFHVRCKARI